LRPPSLLRNAFTNRRDIVTPFLFPSPRHALAPIEFLDASLRQPLECSKLFRILASFLLEQLQSRPHRFAGVLKVPLLHLTGDEVVKEVVNVLGQI
jgi:hypothetical protein